MDELQEQLILKAQELEEIIHQAEKLLASAPEGTLRISHNKNTEQFYLRTDPKDTQGIYIKKSEKELIRLLAQKEYARKVLPVVKKDRKNLKKFMDTYKPKEAERIYDGLSSARKKLIIPYTTSEEEFVRQWEEKTYSTHYQISEDTDGIYTEKGEAVRSKSEKILADKLYMMNILYHYEKPLFLHGYGYIYPDFTVLNRRTRKEYYWEHFGIMDQSEYCEKAIKKIETMQKNGFYQGESLILTYETLTHPLNIKIVDGLIKKYLV